MNKYKQIGALALEGKLTVGDNTVFHINSNGNQLLYLKEQNLRLEGSNIFNLSIKNSFFDNHHIDINILKEFFSGGKNRINHIIAFGYDFQIIKKVSLWYMYDKTKLANNLDALHQILEDNPELTNEIEFYIIMRLARDYCVFEYLYETNVSEIPFPIEIWFDDDDYPNIFDSFDEVKLFLENDPKYQVIKEKIITSKCIIDDVNSALSSDNAINQLINFLKNDNEEVRKYVAIELGRIGDNQAVGPLIEALENYNYSRVIKWAAWALGEIGNEQAVESLIRILESNHDDIMARSQAARALGKIKDKRAVEPLIASLDPELINDFLGMLDTAYFNSAITTLGGLRDMRAVDPLKALLDRCRNENIADIADVTQDVLAKFFQIEC